MTKVSNQKEVDQLKKNSCSQLSKIIQLTIGQWYLDKKKAIQNDITNIDVLTWCTGLQELEMNGVQITTLDKYAIIKQIKLLKIVGCNNIINFKFLKKCHQVESFMIWDMSITNINMILYLKKLKKLHINHNFYITDFSALSQCINLTKLVFWRTSISNLSPIVNLEYLEELWIFENKNLPNEYQKNEKFDSEEVLELFEKWKKDPRNTNHLQNRNDDLIVQIQKQSVFIEQLQNDDLQLQNKIKQMEDIKNQKQDSKESQVQKLLQIQQDLHNQILENQQQNTTRIQKLQEQSQEQVAQITTLFSEQQYKQAQKFYNIQEQSQQQIILLQTFIQEQNQIQALTLQKVNKDIVDKYKVSINTLQEGITNNKNYNNKSICQLLDIMQSDK